MADPLSVIASVLTVGTAALHGSRKLYELLEDINGAPAQFTAIARDSKAFHAIVASLESSLNNFTVNSVLREDAELRTMVGNLEEPIRHCSLALELITVKVEKNFKPANAKKGVKFKISDLKWYFSKKGVKELMDSLGHEKATLGIALDAVMTYV